MLPSIVILPDVVVVAKEEPPVSVTEPAKTSPSASTMNLAESFTAMPKRFVSAAAEAGFMRIEASVTFEPETPKDHEPKVCVEFGTLIAAS